MSNFEQEIRNRQFKQVTGSAPTFQSIDGVGPKTAEKVKGTIIEGEGRIQAPQDVSDLTDDTLAEKAGISKNRARKVIKGAGGNPDRQPRSTTGSVSAAGIKLPQGEFVTEVSDQDKAEAKFSTSRNRGIGRSQNAAIADKSKRAPVTTDFERWKSNKGELDFPGVDTPTESPDVRPKDLRQEQRPDTTDPQQSAAARSTVPDTPSTERNTSAPLPFTTGLSERGASLSPEEAFEGVATGSAETRRQDPDSAMPTFDPGMSDVAGGEEADIAFVRAEEDRSGGAPSISEELNDLYDNGESDDSVPTRPYESRNDGPPSEVGPYELTQDRQNDGFRTVAFQNKESDRSVVFQTYNTDLDGPEATVDVSYGENTETIAEGDAGSVYQQFIGELEERRDRNKERDSIDGSGIQSRADERLEAAQRLFGDNQ